MVGEKGIYSIGVLHGVYTSLLPTMNQHASGIRVQRSRATARRKRLCLTASKRIVSLLCRVEDLGKILTGLWLAGNEGMEKKGKLLEWVI